MPVEKALGEVQDGAVLGADVLDARGNVLLARGTALTRGHVQLLERRGIEAVTVALPGETAVLGRRGPADPAVVAECLARQEQVFAKVRQDPRMEAVYQAARAHLERGNLPPG